VIRALAFLVALSGLATIAIGVDMAVTAVQSEPIMVGAVGASLHDTYYISLFEHAFIYACVAVFFGVCQVALAGWTFKTLSGRAVS